MHHPRFSLLSLTALLFASSSLWAQTYERIDVNDQGQPASYVSGQSGTARAGEISDDGRFVVFMSDALNLDPAHGVGNDVFLRDRQLSQTRVISPPAAGALLQLSAQMQPRISGDASTIAYSRGMGTLLVEPFQAFLYARATGVTTPILVPNLINVRVEALSFDGTFAVLIASTTADPNAQVFRLHIPSGAIVLCTRDANGNPVGGVLSNYRADIDADGTHVAFVSSSSQIVPGDTNGVVDAFVYDVPGNVMLRASVDSNGIQGNGGSSCTIDGDGRFVAMGSTATNLVLSDTNQAHDAFVRDTRLAVTTRASVTTTQAQLTNGVQSAVFISRDASTVVFSSFEQGLIPGDGPLTFDLFVRDLQSGALLPVSGGSSGLPMGWTPLGISGDGRQVLSFCDLPSVAPGSLGGIFVTNLGPRCSSSGYCTSLPDSTGQAATIGAQGDASRQLNNLVISAVGLPDTANAMLISGTSAVDPGTPFGNGLMCIGGALIRHGIHVAIGGVILDAQDVHSAEYVGVNPGDTRYYQVVYRDPAAGGAMFNTTDAVAVTFCW